MAEPTITTTFRFPVKMQELLGRMSEQLNTSKTHLIRQSVLLAAGLLEEASQASHADLFELRSRYGNDARVVIGVFEEDGGPVGKLIVNGKPVEDVMARPYVNLEAGEVHVFLDVLRQHDETPRILNFGDETLLFAPYARFPVGTLPWPPKRNLAIVLELAGVEQMKRETTLLAESIEG